MGGSYCWEVAAVVVGVRVGEWTGEARIAWLWRRCMRCTVLCCSMWCPLYDAPPRASSLAPTPCMHVCGPCPPPPPPPTAPHGPATHITSLDLRPPPPPLRALCPVPRPPDSVAEQLMDMLGQLLLGQLPAKAVALRLLAALREGADLYRPADLSEKVKKVAGMDVSWAWVAAAQSALLGVTHSALPARAAGLGVPCPARSAAHCTHMAHTFSTHAPRCGHTPGPLSHAGRGHCGADGPAGVNPGAPVVARHVLLPTHLGPGDCGPGQHQRRPE